MILKCYLHNVLSAQYRNGQLVPLSLNMGQLFKKMFYHIVGIDFTAGCTLIPLSRTARRILFYLHVYGYIALRHVRSRIV